MPSAAARPADGARTRTHDSRLPLGMSTAAGLRSASIEGAHPVTGNHCHGAPALGA